jgi:prolyl-tRNA synthetase
MAHSDDDGLVLPPKLAPVHVVIIPIFKGKEQLDQIAGKAREIKKALESKGYSVKFDDRDTQKPGWKFAEYELKGIPIRIAIGPRDLENKTVEVARRDTKEKMSLPLDGLDQKIVTLLDDIQDNIYKKAFNFRKESTIKVDSYEAFKEVLDSKGGFILAHWDGTAETEQRIKEETKATIRCIPLDAPDEEGKCILTGKPSSKRVVFAKAY